MSDEIEDVLRRYAKRSMEITNRDRELTTSMAFISNGMILSTADHALACHGKGLIERNREHLESFLSASREAQHVPAD